MNTVNLWAAKTFESSSSEGSSHIRQELKSLQSEMDNLMLSVSNARAALDAAMLRWTDFNKSIEQMHRWLKEREDQSNDDELKADLTEKRAALQKTKVIFRISKLSSSFIGYIVRCKRLTQHTIQFGIRKLNNINSNELL